MDITRDITYRGTLFNDAAITPGVPGPVAGSVVEQVNFSQIDVAQFTEKRSQKDGLDAGIVTLGAQHINMVGTLYDTSRGKTYDRYLAMRAAMSPTLAMREEPGDKGYLPLYFSMPTDRTDDYPDGVIDLQMFAMPKSFVATFYRKGQGGVDANPLSLPWQGMWVMRDPMILSSEPIEAPLDGSGLQMGTFNNRGTDLSPVNLVLYISGTGSQTITCSIGPSDFVLTVPSGVDGRIVRVKDEKLVTIEQNGVELNAMDTISISDYYTWPVFLPGTAAWSVNSTGTLLAPSRLWAYEHYA